MSNVFNLDDYRETRGREEDARYYQFLLGVNEHGDYDRACRDSELTRIEVERHRASYPEWDMAVKECFSNFLEDVLTLAVRGSA